MTTLALSTPSLAISLVAPVMARRNYLRSKEQYRSLKERYPQFVRRDEPSDSDQ